MNVPIQQNSGIELIPSSHHGIATAVVRNSDAKMDLSWDRYVRLKSAAEAADNFHPTNVLDAGGYDGALAHFLKCKKIDVLDPATTGGSVLNIQVPDRFYDAVVAVDVLEHIEPSERKTALNEFARVSNRILILNFPCQSSKDAQKLALKLTQNPLIREHVEWELPDSAAVLQILEKHHFAGTVVEHTSIATWLGQFVTLNLLPDEAAELNRHLILHHSDEPTSNPLYHLLICERKCSSSTAAR